MNNAIITSYSFENFAIYSLQMYVQFNLFFMERFKTLIRLDDNVSALVQAFMTGYVTNILN